MKTFDVATDDVSFVVAQLPTAARTRGSGTIFIPPADGKTTGKLQVSDEFAPDVAAAMQPSAKDQQVKTFLKGYAANKRWQFQIGGTQSGLPTDDASRLNVANAIQSIDLGIMSEPVDWSTPAGFQSLTKAQLLSMAQEMAAHVESCFSVQKSINAAIDAGSITTTSEIDLADWPASNAS